MSDVRNQLKEGLIEFLSENTAYSTFDIDESLSELIDPLVDTLELSRVEHIDLVQAMGRTQVGGDEVTGCLTDGPGHLSDEKEEAWVEDRLRDLARQAAGLIEVTGSISEFEAIILEALGQAAALSRSAQPGKGGEEWVRILDESVADEIHMLEKHVPMPHLRMARDCVRQVARDAKNAVQSISRSGGITADGLKRITDDQWSDLMTDHSDSWEDDVGDVGRYIDEDKIAHFLEDVAALIGEQETGQTVSRDQVESTLYDMLTEVKIHGDSAIQGAEILASFLDGEDPDGAEFGIRMFCSDFAEKVFGEQSPRPGSSRNGRVTVKDVDAFLNQFDWEDGEQNECVSLISKDQLRRALLSGEPTEGEDRKYYPIAEYPHGFGPVWMRRRYDDGVGMAYEGHHIGGGEVTWEKHGQFSPPGGYQPTYICKRIIDSAPDFPTPTPTDDE